MVVLLILKYLVTIMEFNRKKILMISVPSVCLLILVAFYIYELRYQYTDDAYIKLGTIEVSPEISGKIVSINIQNNRSVKKGDTLFEIEDTVFKASYQQALADLQITSNNILSAKKAYGEKENELEQAKADFNYWQSQLDRYSSLVKNNTVSQADYDQVQNKFIQAKEKINEIELEKAEKRFFLDGDVSLAVEDYSMYKKAKAEADKAKFYLDCTKFISPADGIVANFYLEIGNIVSPGQVLFAIMKPNDLWVEADFKETQITKMRKGQYASVEVDSFPDIKFNAKIDSITPASGNSFSILPAQNSSGNWVKVTQRVMVKLLLEGEVKVPLGSGMSVEVTVDTES